ncbi:hypothetical protein [Microbacterium marinilacus]|uniref:Uncharacterized protein n=1 Tax=Microbacterium marinilacus TaxID=415209 RepID=A0ABP7BRA0_9MICO|nr:hypothetical protein [Microbacterium marinilacus]MBY0689821.1 hypothetical protein [Microbacterium marinilacus]
MKKLTRPIVTAALAAVLVLGGATAANAGGAGCDTCPSGGTGYTEIGGGGGLPFFFY